MFQFNQHDGEEPEDVLDLGLDDFESEIQDGGYDQGLSAEIPHSVLQPR